MAAIVRTHQEVAVHKYFTLVLLFPLATLADEPKEALKKMEGKWKIVVAERDGEKLSAEKVKLIKVTIAGDQMTIKDDKFSDAATIKIDPSKKPATIDLQPPMSEKEAPGIYEWSGEQLKLCWTMVGGTRPKEFASTAETKTVLFIMEREK